MPQRLYDNINSRKYYYTILITAYLSKRYKNRHINHNYKKLILLFLYEDQIAEKHSNLNRKPLYTSRLIKSIYNDFYKKYKVQNLLNKLELKLLDQ